MSPLTLEALPDLQPLQTATRGWIAKVIWSPDGRLLACGSAGGVAIWRGSLSAKPVFIKGHDGPAKGVAFAANGATFATGSADTTVKVWDLRAFSVNMQPVNTYTLPDAVDDVVFLANVDVVAACVDGGVYLCAADGTLSQLYAHDDEVHRLAVSSDGRSVASGGRDGVIRLWDATTRAVVGEIAAHSDWVRSVAFHPSEPLLLSGSRDKTAVLWDVSTPDNPTRLQEMNHLGDVRAVGFAVDGAALLTGSTDGHIHLWRTTDGVHLGVLQHHTKPVLSLAPHPSGAGIASGGGDNQIVMWGV
ncbi:MAG: WD40 repeat domain-containing protein [Chloroflexota bacterium]